MTEGNGKKPDRSDMPSSDKDHPRSTADQGGADRADDGWSTYRSWLTRVSHSSGRHSRVDSAIYTWKGYMDWTEKVKREWEPDS